MIIPSPPSISSATTTPHAISPVHSQSYYSHSQSPSEHVLSIYHHSFSLSQIPKSLVDIDQYRQSSSAAPNTLLCSQTLLNHIIIALFIPHALSANTIPSLIFISNESHSSSSQSHKSTTAYRSFITLFYFYFQSFHQFINK